MSTATAHPTADDIPFMNPLAAVADSATGEDSLASAARRAKVMIVDDEPTNIKVVQRLLQLDGFSRFVTTTEAASALALLHEEQPDVVLLDLMMPRVSGLEILTQVRTDEGLCMTPVIILTAATDRETKLRALEAGATDFLGKPVDPSELMPRVRNILAVKTYQNRLQTSSRDLAEAVRVRTAQLEASRQDAIHCLARAAEFRDDDTGCHVLRVGKYARLLGEAVGMSHKECQTLEQAAQLHDVGKIGIPDDVLLKPAKLTEEELVVMRKHCAFGKHILRRANNEEEKVLQQHAELGARILGVGTAPVLELATRIALTHHEWWDGTGYPLKLKGEEIPLEGRITAVADVFDALSSKRCYKDSFPLDKCFSTMKEERGTHFEPRLLDLFLDRRSEIIQIQLDYADES
jgi:putative two-component system response regulator